MTYDEAWSITTGILRDVKNPRNWTAELFDRVREAPYFQAEYPEHGCIFNRIRKVLLTEDYYLFDTMYCHYIRTGQVPGIGQTCELIRKGVGDWEKRKEVLLRIKKKLLMKQSRQ